MLLNAPSRSGISEHKVELVGARVKLSKKECFFTYEMVNLRNGLSDVSISVRAYNISRD